MRYVAIDIETTGLDRECNNIVEFAAVIDDTEKPDKPIEELPRFRAVLLQETGDYLINVATLAMHRRLYDEIAEVTSILGDDIKGKLPFVNSVSEDAFPAMYCLPEQLAGLFSEWLKHHDAEYSSDHDQMGIPRYEPYIFVAGKCAASIDLPWLRHHCEGFRDMIRVHRRIIDPAMMFILPGDVEVPSLSTCMVRGNTGSHVKHTAVDDACDVIRLVRAGLRRNQAAAA